MGRTDRHAPGFILRTVPILILTLAAGFLQGCGPGEPPATGSPEPASTKARAQAADDPLDDLLGAWEADLEHNSQQARFVVEFARGEDDAVIARIAMPALDVWSLPAWQMTMKGDEVRLGSTTLTYDAAAGTIVGVMPDSLVPIHRIPLELRRVDSFERPPDHQEALPTRNPLWTFETGGPVWAGVTYTDGIVYVGSDDGIVYALGARDGGELWQFASQGAIRARLVRDGQVYFGSFDGRIRAVHAETGTLLWEHPTGAPVPSSAAWYEGRMILGSRSYDLLALDAGDGSISWSYYDWFSWIESTAVVRDGIAYIGASDSQRLSAIDAGSGRLVWAFDTGGSAWAEPAVSDDAVFIGAAGVADYMVDHRGGFFAVERASGRGLWHFPAKRAGDRKLWGFTSSPAVGDGLVFVAGLDGEVRTELIRRSIRAENALFD